MLAAGTAPEVLAGQQDRRAGVPLVVEHEVRVLAPFGEQERAEPGPFDPFEVLRRDDLVGVHVGTIQRDGGAGEGRDGLQGCWLLGRVG